MIDFSFVNVRCIVVSGFSVGLWSLQWKKKKKPGGVKSSQSPLLLIPHHGHTDTCTQDFPNDSAEWEWEYFEINKAIWSL